MMLKDKLACIKLLLLDVDGVLTDGTISYTDHGDEVKSFNSKDGLGIKLLLDHGVKVGIVTGRKTDALHHRCRDLGIDLIFDSVSDKAGTVDTILQKMGTASFETGFAGDDLPDLPAMKRVGVSITVADAPGYIQKACDMVTMKKGGCGAVREICEEILKAKGIWHTIIHEYLP